MFDLHISFNRRSKEPNTLSEISSSYLPDTDVSVTPESTTQASLPEDSKSNQIPTPKVKANTPSDNNIAKTSAPAASSVNAFPLTDANNKDNWKLNPKNKQ